MRTIAALIVFAVTWCASGLLIDAYTEQSNLGFTFIGGLSFAIMITAIFVMIIGEPKVRTR